MKIKCKNIFAPNETMMRKSIPKPFVWIQNPSAYNTHTTFEIHKIAEDKLSTPKCLTVGKQ